MGRIFGWSLIKVLEYFGKRHADVIRKIENLKCSIGFNGRNFALISYRDSRNRPCYELTRDEFSFLVNKMNGPKAAEFTEKFIGTFNAMEKALSGPKKPLNIHWKLHNATLRYAPEPSMDSIKKIIVTLKNTVTKMESNFGLKAPPLPLRSILSLKTERLLSVMD